MSILLRNASKPRLRSGQFINPQYFPADFHTQTLCRNVKGKQMTPLLHTAAKLDGATACPASPEDLGQTGLRTEAPSVTWITHHYMDGCREEADSTTGDRYLAAGTHYPRSQSSQITIRLRVQCYCTSQSNQRHSIITQKSTIC